VHFDAVFEVHNVLCSSTTSITALTSFGGIKFGFPNVADDLILPIHVAYTLYFAVSHGKAC